MQLLWNLFISNKTSDTSLVSSKEQWKKFKSMEIKKLNHKEEWNFRDVLKNGRFKNLVSLLQTIKKYCSKNRKKNIRGIFRIMLDSCNGAFLQKYLMVEIH